MQDILPFDADTRRLELLLDRHLAGATSPEESLELRELYLARGGNPEWLRVIERYWNGSWSNDVIDPITARNALLQRIQGERQERTAPSSSTPLQQPRPPQHRPWWRGGWPIGIGVTVALLGLLLGQTDLLRTSSHAKSQRATLQSSYATTNGQRATITLPDGSTVILNVASHLEVPVAYASGDRTVYLSGEALFNVQHSGTTPLTVVTDVGTVRVLGTSFVVRHYATDPTQLVVVRDGKVAVAGAAPASRRHPVILTANYQAEITPASVVSMGPANSGEWSFATGTLSLVHQPFAAAIPELNRWYDTEIRLGDPSLERHQITGDFPVGSLSDLVAVLELAYDVRVVRNGRALTLYAK